MTNTDINIVFAYKRSIKGIREVYTMYEYHYVQSFFRAMNPKNSRIRYNTRYKAYQLLYIFGSTIEPDLIHSSKYISIICDQLKAWQAIYSAAQKLKESK